MKYFNFRLLMLALLFSAGVQITSCKSKSANTTDTTPGTGTTVDSSTAPATAPVTISDDDQLKTGVSDATKDYPGVNATVSGGEVTLTGDIKRDRLPKLMMAIQALHPKKVTNHLTVK